MNDQIARYMRKHSMLVIVVVIAVFLALAGGEYYLFRQQMHLNNMVSEGFMQVKELQMERIRQDTEMEDKQPVMEKTEVTGVMEQN